MTTQYVISDGHGMDIVIMEKDGCILFVVHEDGVQKEVVPFDKKAAGMISAAIDNLLEGK